MVVAMMTMTMSFAENENTNAVKGIEAYDMTVNMRKLAVTLGLTFDQMEAVGDIHHQFVQEMMMAAAANSVSKGDFDVSLPPVKNDDAIGVVTRAFNKMVASIKAYITKLSIRSCRLDCKPDNIDHLSAHAVKGCILHFFIF